MPYTTVQCTELRGTGPRFAEVKEKREDDQKKVTTSGDEEAIDITAREEA